MSGIKNGVKETRRRVPPTDWEHCVEKVNPVDLPSCGITATKQITSDVIIQLHDGANCVLTSINLGSSTTPLFS